METPRPTICQLLFLCLFPLCLWPATAQANESLWLLPSEQLEADTQATFAQLGTDPRFGDLDALAVRTDPPTFSSFNPAFVDQFRRLDAQSRTPLIKATYTVGREGWETSNHRPAAEARGLTFHPERNLSREQWFAYFDTLPGSIWGLTIETIFSQQVTMNQLARYVAAFGQAARNRGRPSALWFTANWEDFVPPPHGR